MKHLIYILLAVIILTGCKKETEPGMIELNEEVSMKTGVIYRSPSFDFSVKVLEINDSRCPTGVVCIWMGVATVRFEVKEKQTSELVLDTFQHRSDTLNNHIFRLIDVLPYPVWQKDIPDSEKKVILEITRL